MDIEVRHARVVVAVVEAQSISKAAIFLGMPQPSLSALLKRIEKAIGGKLFDRRSSGVTLTMLGQHLVPMLTDLVRRADEIAAEASQVGSATLWFGNVDWTPPTMQRALQRSVPEMMVRTVTTAPAAAVHAVHMGQLTMALVPSLSGIAPVQMNLPGLAAEVVIREPVWLALPHGHPLAECEAVNWPQLSTLSWVRQVPEHWFYPAEQHIFAHLGALNPGVVHHVGGHAEAMSWVRDGGMAALVPPTAASPEVSLVGIPDPPQNELLLVWSRSTVRHNTVRLVADAVRGYHLKYARSIPRYRSWIMRHPLDFADQVGIRVDGTPAGATLAARAA
jgi:DNA-binding transcriptional LysR family regulator